MFMSFYSFPLLVTKANFLLHLQENVEGSHCDRCKTGFYNLEERNPQGCSECFCFGVSDVCESLSWPVSQVGAPSGSWGGGECGRWHGDYDDRQGALAVWGTESLGVGF